MSDRATGHSNRHSTGVTAVSAVRGPLPAPPGAARAEQSQPRGRHIPANFYPHKHLREFLGESRAPKQSQLRSDVIAAPCPQDLYPFVRNEPNFADPHKCDNRLLRHHLTRPTGDKGPTRRSQFSASLTGPGLRAYHTRFVSGAFEDRCNVG